MTEKEAKEKVIMAGRRLVESGLITRTWGNVSCRIDENHFAITPSGRDYRSIGPEDIVKVSIGDCSYTGDIKPSSEKGVHSEVYQHYPDIHFVIHTHQENASVISALGLDSIIIDSKDPLLGDEILCASYGLPGTKKLKKSVADVIKKSKGNVIILKHHGAVCFGKDEEEAFRAALELEEVCESYIVKQYLKLEQKNTYNPDDLRQFALLLMGRNRVPQGDRVSQGFCNSERTENGFQIYEKNGKETKSNLDEQADSLNGEAAIHKSIYNKYKKINYIIHADTPNILSFSHAGINLYPFVDDFAQIVGTKVAAVKPAKAVTALKGAAAVIINNNGAFCCGANEIDAAAVALIMEKNCKVFLSGTLFGKIKPIGWLDRNLMRIVYIKKYSRQISNNWGK
ncbi:class II aldolase/adducin family protein [Anaerocolumna sp. MB42-C2]|uniref:class II aldolase/adducin family protein n=1 Tax=Anaerocolumna sp. MB42-C2 TaxID=3070997 RepID=UPI0027DFBD54|nr:class II aldolase/adducin family protein [Anaerocolumna sp. MB42-C2]WMJ87034.1 class II aldolase/adducin family protein [Anaerocolumna sp. MB42-C2]